MPRLAANNYLHTHDRLRKLWLRDESVFAELSPTDQWLLHDFFKPSRGLSDLALLAHREAVTGLRPSLPHQAGRALSRFWGTTARLGMIRVARAKAPAGPGRVRQADRKLVVKALARPDMDAEKLARAFLAVARGVAEKKLAQQQGQQDNKTGQDRGRP